MGPERLRHIDPHQLPARSAVYGSSPTVNQFSVCKDTLRIDVTCTTVIRAHFRGRSALRQPEAVLKPLFDKLIADARPKGLHVHLHFEELEFFNSPTISSVIKCILAMRDQGVRTTVRYDGRQKWQQLFFEGLAMLRRGDLEVQSV